MAVRIVARGTANAAQLKAGTMDVLLLAANVANGVDRGDGTTGTLNVAGYTYGDSNAALVLTTASGAGTYQPVAVADVQEGVAVGVSPAVGTFNAPATGDVRLGTGYGAAGTEFEGTLSVPDYTTITSSAGRVQQICEALIALLDAADGADAFFEDINATRVYTTLSDLSDVGDSVVCYVAPQFTKRTRDSNGTYRRYAVIEILVRIHLTNDATVDRTTMDNRTWLLEQIDDYLAEETNADLTLAGGAIAQYVEPTDTRADSDITDGLGVLWDSDDLDNKRQVTGLVRVAYWVDEDY
jgi:hypothetical protein